MNIQSSTTDRVTAGLAAHEYEVLESCDGILTLRTPLACAADLLGALRNECCFEVSTFVTAVDHGFELEEAGKPRFDMIWQFQSVTHSDRVRVHSWTDGAEPIAPSIIELWPGSAYGERECYDMFGIRFEGHTELKRLLMPDAYEYFPLRKDFPHQGIEPDRLYKAWDRERRQATGDQA